MAKPEAQSRKGFKFLRRSTCLRLYEMDAVYTSTMLIYAVNFNKKACVNSKMSTGSGY